MRKFLIIVLCLLISLSALVGCTDGGGDTPGGDGERVEDKGEYAPYYAGGDTRYADRVSTEATFDVDRNMSSAEAADLSLDAVFGSGMVLQRGYVNKLSGKTTAENVAVMYKNQTYYGTVTDGSWEVYLPAMEANNNAYRLFIYTEKGKMTLTDVFVGEVFVLAGQSNMDIAMASFPEHNSDMTGANDNALRLFLANNQPDDAAKQAPVEEYAHTTYWNAARPDTVASFSCTGYLFGRKMRELLNVPVGLVDTAVGGTSIGYWLPEEKFEEINAKEGISLWSSRDESMPGTNLYAGWPALGFNGIINPLKNLTVRGTVWYQGETDAMQAGGATVESYAEGLRGLISSWRNAFDNPNMLFTIIELPRWDEVILGYADVRTASQQVAAEDKNVCMSVSVDLGETSAMDALDSIHPNDKSKISRRAAEMTAHAFFGIQANLSPEIEKIERVSASEIKITLKRVGFGLTLNNGSMGFEISEDGIIFTDRAVGLTLTLDDSRRVLTLKADTEFVAVRYGVSPTSTLETELDTSKQVTVYNSYGMPLDQFLWSDEA